MLMILELLYAILISLYYMVESLVLCFIPRSSRYKNVEGEIVLVTGAGSGVGRLLCFGFANLGCKVVAWDINKEATDETVHLIKQNGGRAVGYVCDVSSSEDVYKQAEIVKQEVGKVSILVNNAGIVSARDLLDIPDNMLKKMFDVNCLSHFWTVKAFLPAMIIAEKGHIVNIASMAGMSGVNKLTGYCASKFAAVGFDESLRTELYVNGKKEIKTTVVCPYYINTGMFEGVNSWFLPILESEYVAEQIISSVLCNEKMLVLPRYGYFLILLKMLLPIKACLIITRATGLAYALDEMKQ